MMSGGNQTLAFAVGIMQREGKSQDRLWRRLSAAVVVAGTSTGH